MEKIDILVQELNQDKEKFDEIKKEGLKHKVKTASNFKKWTEFSTACGIVAYIDALLERINNL